MRQDGMNETDRINAINNALSNVKMELNGIDGVIDMLDRSVNSGYSDIMTEELSKCLLKSASDLQQLAVEIKYNAERLRFGHERAK